MDTHRNTISVAIAESGRRGELRFAGEIPNRPDSVAKMAGRRTGKLASAILRRAQETPGLPRIARLPRR